MEQALADLNCRVIQSTSDAAPGLLASVEPHLGAHHAPDLFHVQHEPSKAVPSRWPPNSGLPPRRSPRQKRRSSRRTNTSRWPPTSLHCVALAVLKGMASLEQVTDALEAARDAHQRLSAQREQVTQCLHALGHAYHCVDLERGVRRTGKLMAGDLYAQIDTIRTIAQQEDLSHLCLERIKKAERVIPKMQATIEFVSGYVRQQVSHLALPQPAAYAMHAPLIPSYDLERVALTRTVTAGAPLRALTERLRTPLFEPVGP